jgi:hypothetical protein
MEPRDDFLFASPSVWEGIARIVDFANTLNQYNSSASGELADHVALSLDWAMVGHDMRAAMIEYDRRTDQEPTPSIR